MDPYGASKVAKGEGEGGGEEEGEDEHEMGKGGILKIYNFITRTA